MRLAASPTPRRVVKNNDNDDDNDDKPWQPVAEALHWNSAKTRGAYVAVSRGLTDADTCISWALWDEPRVCDFCDGGRVLGDMQYFVEDFGS